MACKNGGTKHNWTVSEKDHDFDVCTECGATRDTRKKVPNWGGTTLPLDEENEIGDDGAFVSDLEEQIDLSLELERMTPKQREVAEMILDGYKQREVAERLNISVSAVSHIVERIKNKLPF